MKPISPPAPTADETAALTQAQTVGNKADVANETAGQASLAGLSRALIARLATFGSEALATAAALAVVDGYHDVPAADSEVNTTLRDVAGNKEDIASETADEASLIALARATIARLTTQGAEALATAANLAVIDAFHDVPAQNSADNVVMSDVIGNKTDGHSGTSLMAGVHTLEEHVHSQGWVLPDLGASIVVTAAAGAWTYGAASATLGTPGDDFDIHWLDIVANNNDQYQVEISVDGTPVWEGAFERTGVQSRSFALPVQMPITAAGSITVKVASAGGSSTINVKAMGHDY